MKTKNVLLLFTILSALSFLSETAQAQAFQKGAKLVDAGFEFTDYDGAGVVPVFANFEAGVTDDIGVGGKLKLWSKNGVHSLTVQGTGNYHFGRLMRLSNNQLDLFGGLGLGINRISFDGYSESGFIVTPQVGARYFFTERVGATAKLGFDHYTIEGYGFTDVIFGLGVSFKF